MSLGELNLSLSSLTDTLFNLACVSNDSIDLDFGTADFDMFMILISRHLCISKCKIFSAYDSILYKIINYQIDKFVQLLNTKIQNTLVKNIIYLKTMNL